MSQCNSKPLTYEQRSEREDRKKLAPELEPIAQEIEILLSNSFETMKLEELKHVDKTLRELVKPLKVGSLRYTRAQVESRDFLAFRIEQETHKNDELKIGDLFYTHWGYDQTNTEFYKIVGFTKTKKSAIVREIGSKVEKGSEGFMCDHVIPDPENELKRSVWDKETNTNKTLDENKPDLKVRIERSTVWNPKTKTREAIGEFHLRGSVYYAGEHKHLQNLYPIKAGDSTYRSWYA